MVQGRGSDSESYQPGPPRGETMKQILVAVMVLLVAGCASDAERTAEQFQQSAAPAVRSPGSEVQTLGSDDARMDPMQRVDLLDQTYRDPVSLALAHVNQHGMPAPSADTTNGDAPQSNPFDDPKQLSLYAAWMYVLAGRDFTAAGDLGGATQAYWAALRLVG